MVLMRRGNQVIKRHAQPTLIALAGTPWQIAVWRPVTPVVERVAPYLLGWLVASLPPFTAGSLSGEIQGYAGSTPYVRWGNAPVLALWGVLGVGLLAAALRRRP
jgi:hypothetical protein